MYKNNLVFQIQQQLSRLGFPDVRDQIYSCLQSGAPAFRVETLLFFKRTGLRGDDFLQYGAEVTPGAANQRFLTSAHVTLLRIISHRENQELSFAQEIQKYQAIQQPLPNILTAYKQLKAKIDSPALRPSRIIRERKPIGRQINPKVPRWRGRGLN